MFDKRNMSYENVVTSCFSYPIPKTTLPPKTFESFKTSKEESVDLNNLPELGSLDYISLDVYAVLIRKLGARIGRYIQGKVVWEN